MPRPFFFFLPLALVAVSFSLPCPPSKLRLCPPDTAGQAYQVKAKAWWPQVERENMACALKSSQSS